MTARVRAALLALDAGVERLLVRLSRVRQVATGRAGPLIGRGNAARDAGRHAVAAAFYEEALRRDPRNAAIRIQCGHMHKEAGNLDAAARHYARALRLVPRDPDLHLQLGHFQKVRGRLEDAAAAYGRAVALLPEWEEPQRELLALSARLRAANGLGPDKGGAAEVLVGSLDGIAGTTAMGWAWDPAQPDRPAEVEFLVDGTVVACCAADLRRDDVKRLGHGSGFNGFRCSLPAGLMGRPGVMVHARLKGSGAALRGSPRGRHASDGIEKWRTRGSRLSLRSARRLRERLDGATRGQVLSVVMPVFDPRPEWLRGAIDSVRAQWCGNWELICVDDCSTDAAVLPILRGYAGRDPRIRVVERARNGGIARATNAGLREARGEYVAFLDHDDHLEPDAVYKLLRATRTGAELIYSDEAITTEDIDAIETVTARPAFSYDFYLSHPYFVHAVCVLRRLALEIGGWDESLAVSGDVDFVLRVVERARAVAHVPAVLYRWRTHRGSAGHRGQAAVTAATADILRGHLRRTGTAATVRGGLGFNQYRIDFEDRPGRTLAVIPTRNGVDLLRSCIESIRRTVHAEGVRIVVVDHRSDDPRTVSYLRSIEGPCEVMRYGGTFNYSAMNNMAVERYGDGCDTVLFLNNDVEATEAGWLDAMRSLASRSEVGAVGATLLYPDSTVQHAGVVIGINGLADHAHRLQPLMLTDDRRFPGHGQSLVSVRDYSAVTGACMMVRRAVFEAVGGFDELLAVGFNDTDLCLRIGEAGLKVLMTPFAVLVHHESATRARSGHLEHPDDSRRFRATWRKLIAAGDPFYNPMLALDGPDHQLGVAERVDRRIGRVRVMPVVLAGRGLPGVGGVPVVG